MVTFTLLVYDDFSSRYNVLPFQEVFCIIIFDFMMIIIGIAGGTVWDGNLCSIDFYIISCTFIGLEKNLLQFLQGHLHCDFSHA